MSRRRRRNPRAPEVPTGVWIALGLGVAGMFIFARALGTGVGLAVREGVRERVDGTAP